MKGEKEYVVICWGCINVGICSVCSILVHVEYNEPYILWLSRPVYHWNNNCLNCLDCICIAYFRCVNRHKEESAID